MRIRVRHVVQGRHFSVIERKVHVDIGREEVALHPVAGQRGLDVRDAAFGLGCIAVVIEDAGLTLHVGCYVEFVQAEVRLPGAFGVGCHIKAMTPVLVSNIDLNRAVWRGGAGRVVGPRIQDMESHVREGECFDESFVHAGLDLKAGDEVDVAIERQEEVTAGVGLDVVGCE